MAQLSKGHTFVPGEVVDPDDLNNLVDQATALAGIITDPTHSAVNATTGDKVLVSRAGVLKQADVSTFPSGVTGVSTTIDSGGSVLAFYVLNPNITPALHIGLHTQLPNMVLAGPATGTTRVTPTFRALTPADLPSATVIAIPANNIIDCTAGSVFWKTLPVGTGPVVLNVSALADGQTIKVNVNNNPAGNNHITWNPTNNTPGIVWRDTGPAPVLSQFPNGRDIFTFTRIHGLTFGYADQRFTQ